MPIPFANEIKSKSKIPHETGKAEYNDGISFCFSSVEENEFFNLDATCQNWAADLFQTLKAVSSFKLTEIYAGKYSGKNSTTRIHSHKDVQNPCIYPEHASLDEMWQIRISKSKGGIHGVFVENVFYVIWFDPHHNLYPDDNHGGLKKIKAPTTCCKDRDEEVQKLKAKVSKLEADYAAAEELINEYGL